MPRERTVAELMKAWRAAAGLNTAAAGERLKLSARAIEDIEQGRRRVDDAIVYEISEKGRAVIAR